MVCLLFSMFVQIVESDDILQFCRAMGQEQEEQYLFLDGFNDLSVQLHSTTEHGRPPPCLLLVSSF